MTIRQLLVDASGCTRALDDADALLRAVRRGIAAVGATEMGYSTVRYVPHGVTVAVILAESHVVVSTWPEHGLLLADILLCNDTMDPERVWEGIAALVQPGEARRSRVVRGLP